MGGRGVDRVVQEHSVVGAVGRRVFPFEILEPKLFPCRHQCLALARSQDVMDRKDVRITVAGVNVLACCRNMRVRWWIWLAYEGTQTAGRSINPKPMKCPAWPHGHACCWSRVVLATPTERSVFLRTYNRGDKACVCVVVVVVGGQCGITWPLVPIFHTFQTKRTCKKYDVMTHAGILPLPLCTISQSGGVPPAFSVATVMGT